MFLPGESHGVAGADMTEATERALSNGACALAAGRWTNALGTRSREGLMRRQRQAAGADTRLPLAAPGWWLAAITEHPQALHP